MLEHRVYTREDAVELSYNYYIMYMCHIHCQLIVLFLLAHASAAGLHQLHVNITFVVCEHLSWPPK